ncbi:RNA polymerase sigma factor [Streptomyces sp. NPDC001544]|uniref:RNA polymerase sigma factor n=1 Tax=Streptomyces sp. NPDC001544 TaxID=3364584 RepID=UPI00369ABCCA
MSGDGRDGSLGDGDAETGGLTSPQVPSQGGRTPLPRGRAETGVPAQREGDFVPPRERPSADGELIGRMRAGDDRAYEELYRRHADAVRRYARTCCRDAYTADDLTAEVFARMLQAVRGGSGPSHAVRAYLLTSVRRVAAHWAKSSRREQLVDDFAVFAAQCARVSEDGGTVEPGADVRAMHEAEESLAMRAFRSLPERWQAVLWHTEVEDESPSQVAALFGLDAGGTRVLASRAREGLKQAYLQAHVSAALTGDEDCARYADQLGTYARRRLRTRAERGLRGHLRECARCRSAAVQIEEIAGGIPAVVPVAVIGWFGAAGYAKALGIVVGGAGVGAAAAAGGSSGGTGGGAGGAVVSEGLGAPVKAAIAAGVVAAGVAAVVLTLVNHDEPAVRTAAPPPSAPAVRPGPGSPAPTPPGRTPAPARPAAAAEAVPGLTATPAATPAAASAVAPEHRPNTGPTPAWPPGPAPVPTRTAPSPAEPRPGPPAPPPPTPVVCRWLELRYDVLAASVTLDLHRACSAHDAPAGVHALVPDLGRVSFSVAVPVADRARARAGFS